MNDEFATDEVFTGIQNVNSATDEEIRTAIRLMVYEMDNRPALIRIYQAAHAEYEDYENGVVWG